MLSEDGKHLHVDWNNYHDLIEQLVLQIHASQWSFDTVLCLARGGMRVGDVVSRIFNRPLAILSTSSYREVAGTQQGHLYIANNVSSAHGNITGKILLTDDLADSGLTLHEVIKHLRRSIPAITDLRSAVLWVKGISVFKPDYYVQLLPTSPWIHQPFEHYDQMRPKDLMKQRHPTT